LHLLEAQQKAQAETHYLDAYAGLMQALGGGAPSNETRAERPL